MTSHRRRKPSFQERRRRELASIPMASDLVVRQADGSVSVVRASKADAAAVIRRGNRLR
jgi:hypothetical protein